MSNRVSAVGLTCAQLRDEEYLGFATAWRVAQKSQRSRCFCSALLLKLSNPIGYGLHHVARSFPGVICLGSGFCGAFGLALLDYSDCFLVRHFSTLATLDYFHLYRTKFPSSSSLIFI